MHANAMGDVMSKVLEIKSESIRLTARPSYILGVVSRILIPSKPISTRRNGPSGFSYIFFIY